MFGLKQKKWFWGSMDGTVHEPTAASGHLRVCWGFKKVMREEDKTMTQANQRNQKLSQISLKAQTVTTRGDERDKAAESSRSYDGGWRKTNRRVSGWVLHCRLRHDDSHSWPRLKKIFNHLQRGLKTESVPSARGQFCFIYLFLQMSSFQDFSSH